MAIDEHRSDFEPTVWIPQENMDIQQVWFAGAHSDLGGSYEPDKDGSLSSDIALAWMIQEAGRSELAIETHLKQSISKNPLATIHNSRRSFYRIKRKYYRPIEHGKDSVLIHESVKLRWDQDSKYRPSNLKKYIDDNGWPNSFVK